MADKPKSKAPTSGAEEQIDVLRVWDRQVAFDVTEDDDSYTITAELPGFQAHNVRVEVDEDGRVLTIGGMKRFPLPTENSTMSAAISTCRKMPT